MTDPIPAATLILARDAADGGPPETLMVRRTNRMAFAAGAWVWPGGRIDDADHDIDGIAADSAAAMREMLEEVGLPVGLSPAPDAALCRQLHDELLNGSSLPDLLDAHDLTIENDLTRLSRWAPNLDLKRRFDTWFLLARAPENLPPMTLQESEVAEARWVSPRAMLAEIEAGDAHAIFPTMRMLERLANADSVDALFADAAAFPPDKIVPWIEERDGAEMICIPDHLGFPVTAVPTAEAFRGEH